MLNFKNLDCRKNLFKNKLFKNRNFKKVGILGTLFLFCITSFLNSSLSANASSQSVLSITKGGTNANNSENAQINLGRTDAISFDSTDNEFPSSKAVYDFIKDRTSDQNYLFGDEGLIARCSPNEAIYCNKTNDWNTFQVGDGNFTSAAYGDGIIIAGNNKGYFALCEFRKKYCAAANNWKYFTINKTNSGWKQIIYAQGLFIAVIGSSVATCWANTGCNDESLWAYTQKTGQINSVAASVSNLDQSTNGFLITNGQNTNFSRCVIATSCSTSDDWTNYPSTITGYQYNDAFYYPSLNAILFLAGSHSDGHIARIMICYVSSSCNETSNWSVWAAPDAYGLGKSDFSQAENPLFIIAANKHYGTPYISEALIVCQINNDCTQKANWITVINYGSEKSFTNIKYMDNYHWLAS
ncbi:MAG: hypothetical protein LBT85_03360, partial [Bifidobacteriaceae bacterium]|nr:hypothetical protein [Bifidobacteriaceae bacterium]